MNQTTPLIRSAKIVAIVNPITAAITKNQNPAGSLDILPGYRLRQPCQQGEINGHGKRRRKKLAQRESTHGRTSYGHSRNGNRQGHADQMSHHDSGSGWPRSWLSRASDCHQTGEKQKASQVGGERARTTPSVSHHLHSCSRMLKRQPFATGDAAGHALLDEVHPFRRRR